jgi:hypothetical protein
MLTQPDEKTNTEPNSQNDQEDDFKEPLGFPAPYDDGNGEDVN